MLAAIQEEEVLEREEQHQQSRPPVNAKLTQLLEDFEQQGEGLKAGLFSCRSHQGTPDCFICALQSTSGRKRCWTRQTQNAEAS